MGKPLSISAIRLKECAGKNESKLPVQQPSKDSTPRQVSGWEQRGHAVRRDDSRWKTVGGLIPWTAKYNQAALPLSQC